MSGELRPTRRLLVANRGEIARRIFRTAHDMGIETVAVYAEGDVGAPYVREAGQAVALAGRSARETYLDTAALLAAARRAGADAVHPGYGFLSERGAFARAVTEAGLVFIGPPAEVIDALGDKLRAKKIMSSAGVPVLDSIEVAPRRAAGALDGVTFPVLVKATAGGGGKGMRVVERPGDLAEAIESASREAAAAFGDGRVFVEPYLSGARHVEIQILGDRHHNLVHLFERECSIQRRHQKIIEEAPSPAVGPELREEMGAAALRAARAVGYENAGTVEFLLGEDSRFFFLEVNTRLQVEHPVTEAVTGLDLVREQLLVAEGARLSFGQSDLALSGHAVEARLYAEDPERDFLPAAGRIASWREAGDPAVRYDSGVETGSVVGVEFDPMLAKVIAHAPTRHEAARRLALALERTAVHGVTTNRAFLVSVLRSDAFLSGATTTAFLDGHRPAPRPVGAKVLGRAAIAAALAAEEAACRARPILSSLPSGWRMSAMPPQRRSYATLTGAELTVSYRRRRDGRYDCTITAEPPALLADDVFADGGGQGTVVAERHGTAGDEHDLSIDGVRSQATVVFSGPDRYVDFRSGESLRLRERPRFPEAVREQARGALVAPMPGSVLSVHVSVGEPVTAGQLLVVVEAMKMEHRLTAPATGTVRELHAKVGEQVSSGDLLVALDHDAAAGESS